MACRPHDECNGSDVFGTDICTCRPYLAYAIQDAVETAQRGGVGIIAYYRKEGRALGEVIHPPAAAAAAAVVVAAAVSISIFFLPCRMACGPHRAEHTTRAAGDQVPRLQLAQVPGRR